MIKDYEKILEQYWQKGGTYILPIEIVNELLGDLEDLESENKHLLELQKSMDKQYEELEEKTYKVLKLIKEKVKDYYGIIDTSVIWEIESILEGEKTKL